MNRAVSPATSARAFAEAKHRHTATINSRCPTDYVEQPTVAVPKLEKLRSHAELSLRKEYHKYTPHEINTARSTYTASPNTNNTSLAFSPSSRIILATGEVLQPPQERGEIFSSHRAFTAAKNRHYTPHRARDLDGVQQQCGVSRPSVLNASTGKNAPNAVESHEYLSGPVAAKRVESGGMNSDASRYAGQAVRTASSNRGTPRTTDSYTRTSTPDARVPNHIRTTTTYGTNTHHLSYGSRYIPAAGSPSRTNSRGAGRRVYTMPKLNTNIIC